ncbi:MAG: hypothetical protein HC848_10260 [Limnobacter sp.]|nr:hypothetical protein [Limnobacter sp.]
MKKLTVFIFILVAAVAVTLLGQENTGKVVLFLPSYRIDFSLNFVLIVLSLLVVLVWFGTGVLKASLQAPEKIRAYFAERRQKALREANTHALMALITGDEVSAEKALNAARKTDLSDDLSLYIRVLSALQANRLDIADNLLNQHKHDAKSTRPALGVLRARLALAKANHSQAYQVVELLPASCKAYPQVQRVRLMALAGLLRWQEALTHYRKSRQTVALSETERSAFLSVIYEGLVLNAQCKPTAIEDLLSQSTPDELQVPGVIRAIGEGLLCAGMPNAACTLLQTALQKDLLEELLPLYQKVASLCSRQSLPFVELAVRKHPDQLKLLEIAGEVLEREQLWGKAIARFETLYQKAPSAHVAGKLERLYQTASQPDKARQWREKLKTHLGLNKLPA